MYTVRKPCAAHLDEFALADNFVAVKVETAEKVVVHGRRCQHALNLKWKWDTTFDDVSSENRGDVVGILTEQASEKATTSVCVTWSNCAMSSVTTPWSDSWYMSTLARFDGLPSADPSAARRERCCRTHEKKERRKDEPNERCGRQAGSQTTTGGKQHVPGQHRLWHQAFSMLSSV